MTVRILEGIQWGRALTVLVIVGAFSYAIAWLQIVRFVEDVANSSIITVEKLALFREVSFVIVAAITCISVGISAYPVYAYAKKSGVTSKSVGVFLSWVGLSACCVVFFYVVL